MSSSPKALGTDPALAEAEERIRELEDELKDLGAELVRSERRVEAMKQIGQVLGSSLELGTMLRALMERTTELLEADRSTLFIVDQQTGELVSKVVQGGEMKEIRLPAGVGIAGWVATSGEPQSIQDAYHDERFNRDVDKETGYRTRGMLVWPVRRPHAKEIIGVIQVLNKQAGAFDRTDERLLSAIASEIGVALEAAQLYQDLLSRNVALEKARGELTLLLETERAISELEDLEAMLDAIAETAVEKLGARTGVIYLLDDRGNNLEARTAVGAGRASIKGAVLAKEDPAQSRVLRGGEAVVLSEPDVRRGRLKVRQLVAVPITTKYDGHIGVLELINKRERGKDDFTDEDVTALKAVASQAGRAIRAEQQRRARVREEHLATIGRLLSGVVHDMRTPLTLIGGYSQVMADADVRAERDEYVRLIQRQIELMTKMTKELLAFARGEQSLLVRKVYLHRFMSEIEEYLEEEFRDSGVDLSVDVRYRGAARFDESKMRRVFYNIARNAKEAMPGGGKFVVSTTKEDGALVFSFEDSGRGIPSDLKGRLFEPFATAGKAGGTGLGLAMVKTIVEEHRGTVRAENLEDGTRFVVSIPVDL